MRISSSLAAATALSAASAHTIMTQLIANGVENGVGVGIRVPTYDGPITDVASEYVACNGGPNPTTPSSTVIDVTAGSTVQVYWRHTLDSDSTDVIDASHKGPVMAYMKKVTDAATDTGVGEGWFKISEEGYDSATDTWAVTNLIANAGTQTIDIPACIEDGQYLLRGELIALHSASSESGAQFYMECAQINVTGGSAASTPETVALPGAYSVSLDYSIPLRTVSNSDRLLIPAFSSTFTRAQCRSIPFLALPSSPAKWVFGVGFAWLWLAVDLRSTENRLWWVNGVIEHGQLLYIVLSSILYLLYINLQVPISIFAYSDLPVG